MDCLNVEKTREPGLLDHQPPPAKRTRGRSCLAALIALLALLLAALLAIAIWAGVAAQQAKHDVRELRQALALSGGAQYQTVSTAGAAGRGGNATLTAVSAAYPAVYLSKSATAQNGYSYAGSLYRGSGYWATQPDLAAPRADFAALNLNETIYVLGGRDASGAFLASALTYDPVRNLTAAAPPLPAARAFAAAAPAADNASLTLVGGFASPANQSAGQPERCSLVFNASVGAWAAGPCLQQARAAACAAVVGGRLFVAGGLGAGGSQLASIEVFSPANASWSTFASLPSGRSGAGCAASGNSLIVAGGTNGSADLSEVWAFDASRGNSSRLAPLLRPRAGLQLLALPGGDVLAVGGGSSANGTQAGQHAVERLSVRSNQWSEKAPLAAARFGFGAAFADEGVYALGGAAFCNGTSAAACASASKVTASVEVFYDADHPDVFLHLQSPGQALSGPPPNTSQVLLLSTAAPVNGYARAGSLYRGSGYWAPGQDLPQPLSDLSVVGYGNVAFILGGLDLDAQDASDALYKYDPAQQAYTNLSSLPEPRTRGGADIIGDTLYYVGGFTSGSDTAEPVATMLTYNITANTWARSPAALSSARSDLCVAAVNGSLYAAGGYSANYTETLNLAERYDPNTRAWTAIPGMPTPRGDLMCAAMNGRFVVAGGFYDPSGQFAPASFRSEVQAFDPATGEWSSLAPLPVARGDAAITVLPSRFGDRLLVTGGESQLDNARTGIATHQVQQYSSALDAWTLKAPISSARFRHDAAYANGGVLLFGGASSSVCQPDGDGLQVCELRPVAAVEQFFDSDDPDVFVYTSL